MLKRVPFIEKIIRRMIILSTDSSAEFINQDTILTIPHYQYAVRVLGKPST